MLLSNLIFNESYLYVDKVNLKDKGIFMNKIGQYMDHRIDGFIPEYFIHFSTSLFAKKFNPSYGFGISPTGFYCFPLLSSIDFEDILDEGSSYGNLIYIIRNLNVNKNNCIYQNDQLVKYYDSNDTNKYKTISEFMGMKQISSNKMRKLFLDNNIKAIMNLFNEYDFITGDIPYQCAFFDPKDFEFVEKFEYKSYNPARDTTKTKDYRTKEQLVNSISSSKQNIINYIESVFRKKEINFKDIKNVFWDIGHLKDNRNNTNSENIWINKLYFYYRNKFLNKIEKNNDSETLEKTKAFFEYEDKEYK